MGSADPMTRGRISVRNEMPLSFNFLRQRFSAVEPHLARDGVGFDPRLPNSLEDFIKRECRAGNAGIGRVKYECVLHRGALNYHIHGEIRAYSTFMICAPSRSISSLTSGSASRMEATRSGVRLMAGAAGGAGGSGGAGRWGEGRAEVDSGFVSALTETGPGSSISNFTPMLWLSTWLIASRTRSFLPFFSQLLTKVSCLAPKRRTARPSSMATSW